VRSVAFMNLHRCLTTAVALAALCGAAACGQQVATPGSAPPSANPNWPARDAARLADPGQALGTGPGRPAEPAALVPAVEVALPSPIGPRSLDDCVAIALQNHPRIAVARAEIRSAQGKAVQARLYPNPVIAGFTPQAAGSDSQWSGTVAQDIVTAGKLRLQEQAALREVQAAEWRLVRARFEVMTAVRRDFYLLLVAQRRQEIFKLLLEIANRSFRIGEQLAKAGEGTRADVLFWSIERDQSEVRLLNAGVTIEAERRRLAVDMAVPREAIGTVEGDLLAQLPDFDIAGLQEAVVSRNALPRAAGAEVARAQWALDRARVQPIPNVNLMGGYQRQVLPAQDQGLYQVMLAVPLFDRNQGNIRAAAADIAAARADLQDVELSLAAQAAEMMNTFRRAQRTAAWYEEGILPKARETVEVTQRLYGQGEVTFLSLLQAQKILTELELAYVEAQAERWTSAVEISDLLQLEVFPPVGDVPAGRAFEGGPKEPVPNVGDRPPPAPQPLPPP
jgi:cobalt-zinc-cadmium efflux system outer membrane protein